MVELTIRPLTETDPIPYDLLLLADPSRSSVDDYMTRGLCFIGMADNRVAGVFVLLRTRPHTVEIVNIAVAEELQGRGIGKELVKSAIEKSKALGASVVEIGTGNSSLQQLALYQKCGFRIAGVDRDFFIRHYEERIIENGIPCLDMIRLRLELD
jgi:Acetyltransferases